MTKEVLLARPHPFIRKSMTEFLTANGYTPVQELSNGVLPAAVVVSSSVTSGAGSFEDVLMMVRRTHRNRPLVVATLLKTELVKNTLSHTINDVFPEKKIGYASEGSVGDVLVVHPDDLKLVETQKLFRQFVR
jgi:hypothetical protein